MVHSSSALFEMKSATTDASSNSHNMELTSTSTKDHLNTIHNETYSMIWIPTKDSCYSTDQDQISNLKTYQDEAIECKDGNNTFHQNEMGVINIGKKWDENSNSLTKNNQDKSNFKGSKNDMDEIDSYMTKFTFIMFGIAGVLNWSVLLNCILSIFTIIYDYPSGADTVLMGYFLLSVISGVFRIRARNMSTKIVYAGIFMLFMTNILLPLTIQFFHGLIGIILLHTIAGVIGLAVSFIVANGLAYACILPKSLTGYVIAGNGLAGLTAFLVWQLLTELFFDIYSEGELIKAVWILFMFCFACVIIHLVLFIKLKQKWWFKESLESFQATVRVSRTTSKIHASDKSDEKSLDTVNSETFQTQCRPLYTLISTCFRGLTLSAISFFISYSLFPNIGPYDWVGTSLQESSILVGTYQTFDFLGRYISNLSKKFLIPQSIIMHLVLLRLLFYPLFITFALLDTFVTRMFPLQLLLIVTCALSNGLIGSQSLSNIPRCVETIAEKGTMGMVMHLSTQIAISLALIFSKILKLALKIHFH